MNACRVTLDVLQHLGVNARDYPFAARYCTEVNGGLQFIVQDVGEESPCRDLVPAEH